MAKTESQQELEIEVVPRAIGDGYVTILITKIYGNVNLKHRGQEMMGGMNWVPDGDLPVGLIVDGEIINNALNKEQLVMLFQDLMQTLMPAIKVLVSAADEKDEPEEKVDF